MTQMVMSRGMPHSLTDSPASLRYGKALFMADNEDVMVMDTKLKIIEILQVSISIWMDMVLCEKNLTFSYMQFIFFHVFHLFSSS